MSARDRWVDWVLEVRASEKPELRPVRDRVLEHADIRAGDTVLDVGAGEGLIALRALELVGPDGRVIFSDVSERLLDHCRSRVNGDGRASFLRASADDLSELEDGSVDVVTTRSVVIYLDRAGKERAFREFLRVLRPGGRISIFEPINGFAHPEPRGVFCGFDVLPVADLAERVKQAWGPPEERTLIDFDERDLLAWAEAAGFAEVHLRYEADVGGASWLPSDWDALLGTAGNPLADSLRTAIERVLSVDEARRFEAHLRPLVERGDVRNRSAVVYIWASV